MKVRRNPPHGDSATNAYRIELSAGGRVVRTIEGAFEYSGSMGSNKSASSCAAIIERAQASQSSAGIEEEALCRACSSDSIRPYLRMAVKEEQPPRGAALGMLEIVAFGVVALGLAALWAVQLVVIPSFAAMFDDFGGELPAITRGAIGFVIAGAASTLSVALAATGAGLRLWRRGGGWIALGLATAVPPLATALLVVAIYAPIFAVADRIG